MGQGRALASDLSLTLSLHPLTSLTLRNKAAGAHTLVQHVPAVGSPSRLRCPEQGLTHVPLLAIISSVPAFRAAGARASSQDMMK